MKKLTHINIQSPQECRHIVRVRVPMFFSSKRAKLLATPFDKIRTGDKIVEAKPLELDSIIDNAGIKKHEH